jgi:hypothetical protein
MFTHRPLARRALVVILLSIVLLIGIANVFPAKADNPPDDGRINKLPWINSYGAVAVYCIDQTGKPASTYQGQVSWYSAVRANACYLPATYRSTNP